MKLPQGLDPDIWAEWVERRRKTWTLRDKAIHWLRGIKPFGYQIIIIPPKR